MFNVLDLFDYEWITTILEKSSWDSKSTSAVLSKYPSNVRKSSIVLFLKMVNPSPFSPTQQNVERSKKLWLDGFNSVHGVEGGGAGEVYC